MSEITAPPLGQLWLRLAGRLGRATVSAVAELGFASVLFGRAVYWLAVGRRRGQPVRLKSVVLQMTEVGIQAIPIVSILAFTIGMMLAIQGIHSLSLYGAEAQIILGVALSVTREFSPLITGVLIAGRSGSAVAARVATMRINQEIDALRVMGIDPARFLAAPVLVAMLVMGPALTIWSDFVALLGAGIYISFDLHMTLPIFFDRLISFMRLGDLWHGLGKSVIFSGLIAIIGLVNGAMASGGAEGVGRVTTRSVVHAISAIVITDMIVAFVVTR